MSRCSRLSTVGVAVAVVLLLLQEARGFSSGAPASVCPTMLPNHGKTPQTSQPPFQIIPGGASVEEGPLSVTLATVSPTGKFKGFFLQAHDANTSAILGRFQSDSNKLVSCDSNLQNGVTHKDASEKQSVVVQWQPPENYAGDVVFRATVVESFEVFWTGITSEKVTVKRSVSTTNTASASTSDPVPAASSTERVTVATTEAVSGSGRVVEGSNPGDVVIRVTDAPSVVEGTTSGIPADGSPALPDFVATTKASPAATTAAAGGPTTRRRGLLGNFRGRPTTAPPPPSTTAGSPTRVRIAGSDSVAPIYLGCGVNKGCFGLPDGCVDGFDCKALFTYSKVDGGYQFEVLGDVASSSGEKYIAGGLSFDDHMGDDSVAACRRYNNEASLVMTFNKGYSNVFLEDPNVGISNIETSLVDGNLLCSYTRAPRTEVNGIVFDLDNSTYYLEVAHGSLAADGSLTYHDEKLISGQSTSLGAFHSLEASSNLFVVLHACFMVAAWVGAASSGIFIARYFKQTWKNYKMCNIDQWFHCHRFFMILTWCLTMVAFGLILWHVNGWTKIAADVNPHAYIGIVSIGLCFIQPFMAALRCAPKHPRRPLFNWLHWGVGNAAQILGITAIFYGLELYGLPRWTWWLMILFVGVHCLLHIFMSIGECVSDSRAKRQVSGGGMPMSEFNGSRDMLQPPTDYIVDAPGATFRKVMLALYLAVVWLVVAALIVVIVVDEDGLEEWGIHI